MNSFNLQFESHDFSVMRNNAAEKCNDMYKSMIMVNSEVERYLHTRVRMISICEKIFLY